MTHLSCEFCLPANISSMSISEEMQDHGGDPGGGLRVLLYRTQSPCWPVKIFAKPALSGKSCEM